MNAGIIAGQMLVLFFMMLAGFIAFKAHIVSQAGSKRTKRARNGANCQISPARSTDRDREMMRPVRSEAFPEPASLATRREIEVWIAPQHRANAIE